MYCSKEDIENLADIILQDIMGKPPTDPKQVTAIDVDSLVEALNLHIIYTALSDSENILGLTTYADVDITLERNMRTEVLFIKADSILVEKRLLENIAFTDTQRGRRRFTIAHECAHQILFRLETELGKEQIRHQYAKRQYSLRELISKDDWCEWQANALAAALLMPRIYIKLLMERYSRKRQLVSYGGRFNFGDSLVLNKLEHTLAVSRSALAIRLKQLGYLVEKQSHEYYDPIEVIFDEPFAI